MSKNKPDATHEVEIEYLTESADGFAHIKSKSGQISGCVVPTTLPGEKAEIMLLGKRKKIYKSKLVNIINPAANRIEPTCPHYESCGGCSLQHISYDDQRRYKQAKVYELFTHLNISADKFSPLIPSDKIFNYRNKVELSFSNDKLGNSFLGFYERAGRGRVCDLNECHIAASFVTETLAPVKDWWLKSGLKAYNFYRDSGSLRTITFRSNFDNSEKMVILTVSGNPEFALKKNDIESFKQTIIQSLGSSDDSLAIFIRIHQICRGRPTNFYDIHVHGKDHITDKITLTYQPGLIKNYHFRISPAAFFQPNSFMAGVIYQNVFDMLQISPNTILYDLYCGTGTMGTCLAPFVKEVHAVEINYDAIVDAKENLQLNSISNLHLHHGDVEKVLQTLSRQDVKPDVVIVDPPRAGLSEKSTKLIIEQQPGQIIYVACNPQTQSENILAFLQSGYEVAALQPIDQFAQTYHVENIIKLILMYPQTS